MSKLTREQYDAVHAILKAHFGGRFQSDDTIDQVAEHLQFPLEPATDAEVKRFSLVMEKVNLGMAFDDFIDTRNKYRIPAPVDPRHKVVVYILSNSDWSAHDATENVSKKILAALDGRVEE